MSRRVLAAASAVVLVQAAAGAAAQEQAAQEQAAEDVAAQVRVQGHACEAPVSATRDTAASRPDQEVWILHCRNAAYRVRLTAGMGAAIETIGD